MSLFFGLNIGLKGMMAQQATMNVALHNIANANTDGYSKQRVTLETSIPISGITSAGQLGSGVEIAEIKRLEDQFLNYQVRKETSTQENWKVIANTLQQVETIFMEPSATGFNELMNEFWNSWQALANSAESSPIRNSLKESAVALTDAFRQMHTQLTEIKNDMQTQIDMQILNINAAAESIARLNQQIVNAKIYGGSPNDFLDQRDLALEKLAAISNLTVSDCVDASGKPTGAIKVALGNDINSTENIIVDGSNFTEITDSSTIKVQDGILAGLQRAGTGDATLVDSKTVQHYINKLDALAVGIAKAVNDIHITGKSLDGSPGQEFFVFKDADGSEIDLTTINWTDPFASGLSAANIYVNPAIEADVSQIAAAQADDGGIFLEGNGKTALWIAQLQNAYFNYDAVNNTLTSQDTGGMKLGTFYSGMMAELGSASAEAQRMTTNQETLVEQLNTRRESIKGVSLDEEMANIINFQHAFQASAKAISVIDEMLNTIINGLKV